MEPTPEKIVAPISVVLFPEHRMTFKATRSAREEAPPFVNSLIVPRALSLFAVTESNDARPILNETESLFREQKKKGKDFTPCPFRYVA